MPGQRFASVIAHRRDSFQRHQVTYLLLPSSALVFGYGSESAVVQVSSSVNSLWEDQRDIGAYLCVNGEVGVPAVGWDDLDYAVLSSLGGNLLHVLEGILELLRCRPKGGSFLQTMGSYPLLWLPTGLRLTPSFDARHVQRWSSSCTEGDRGGGGEWWVGAIAGEGETDLDLGGGGTDAVGRGGSHGGCRRSGGGGGTSSRGRHHHGQARVAGARVTE